MIAGVLNLRSDFGAVGDGATDDTPAVQAARDAAAAGGGAIFVPPGEYRTKRINDTLGNGIVWQGTGPASRFLADAGAGIWWDSSGSVDMRMRDLAIGNYAATVPDVLFFLGGAAAGYCRRNSFENVAVDAASAVAHAYLYGALGTAFRDCNWTQRRNGLALAANQDNLRSCVLRADAVNRFRLSSAFTSTLTGPQGVWHVNTEQCWFTDDSVGATGNSNNAAVILECVGLSQFDGGGFSSSGVPLVIWNNSEAIDINGTALASANGSLCQRALLKIGGGYNGDFMIAPFFSVVAPGGQLIALGEPVDGIGGLNRATIGPVGIGGGTMPILGCDFAVTAPQHSPPWLTDVEIEGQGLAVNVAGDIDASCRFSNVSAISVPAGRKSLYSLAANGYRANRDGSYEIWGQTGPISPSGVIQVFFPALGQTQVFRPQAVADGVPAAGVGGAVSCSTVGPASMWIVNQSPTYALIAHWSVLVR